MFGGGIVLWGVIAALLGGSIVWGLFFARDSKIHRQLFRRKIDAIAAVSPVPAGDTVRITGTVERIEEDLWAPLTRRRCVHYLTIVEERQRTSALSRHAPWTEVIRLERSVDFLLRDASGLARVRMDRAQVAVVRDIHTRSGFLDDPTPMEREFLEMQGEDPTDGAGMNRGLRYTEGVIEVGEVVTALGVALPGDDTCRLVLGAPPDGHVLVTDEPTTVHSVARDAH
jgi:hypothetical protein